MNKYSYNSITTHIQMIDGKKVEVTEAVSIRNGEGYKTVTTRENGKKKQAKHKLTEQEMSNIKERKFMQGFFDPCYLGLGPCAANAARATSLSGSSPIVLTRQKRKAVKKGTKKNKRNA